MAKDDFKIKVHRLGSLAPIEVKGQDLRIIESNQNSLTGDNLTGDGSLSGFFII